MIDPTRAEILRRLAALSELDPEQRFGQLITNLANLAIGPAVEATWDVEDTELLAAINEHIENRARYRDILTPAAAPDR